ncbi:MAG: autotransporter outer membrane beta-barrel domain-containing protein [Nostoc sp.]
MSIFTVTNTNNSGLGSLRQQILNADLAGGTNIINFGGLFSDAIAHTINLTGSSLSITDNVTIEGTNASLLTIKDDSADRVFDIGKGATSAINRLTITNTYDGASGGGAISNEGIVILSDSIIKGNTVSDQINTHARVGVASFAGEGSEGGGILNTGSLTVNHSTIIDNRAAYGGSIYNTGSLTVNHSTVTDNRAGNSGGGIYNTGSLTVNYSAVTDNRAGDGGGGIFTNTTLSLSYKSSIATVSYSTISGNQTGGDGGGIGEYSFSYLVVENSTITSNKAYGDGGGIDDDFSYLVVENSTITSNKAYDDAGGIYKFNSQQYTEYNSRIYNNSPDNVVSMVDILVHPFGLQ